jgi:hypothetical protein
MAKAQIIEKDVILIRITADGIIKENFKHCRLYNGTHSIKTLEWTYYCKSGDYYIDVHRSNAYCLIININIEHEAEQKFYYEYERKLKDNIVSLETVLENAKKHTKKQMCMINDFKKIKVKTAM